MTASEKNRVLVAWYSASGCTRKLAEGIARLIGADLFEIRPSAPYTDADLNWNNPASRVSREHDDETLRDVPLAETAPADFGRYGTVLIGYPIWWGIAAWPVNRFVKDNDFTGKRVIPFATSYSSAFGESGELLKRMNPSGTWVPGVRFSSYDRPAAAEGWLKRLGLLPASGKGAQ
ncbi:MAG: Flavodoxin [Burkholderia sp.]|jgi:hypothetical protein